MKNIDSKFIYGLIILVALSRLVPHPWNVTPMGALALFSGAYMSRRIAWFIPVIALLISDLIIGLYNPITMAFVYCAFAFSAVIGRVMLYQRRSVNRTGITVLIGALSFFLISNLGPWIAFYPLTIDGLMLCYINGLPFFGRTLMGDGVYVILLFGGFETVRYITARFSNNNVIKS